MDGEHVLATPDTGSEVDLISPGFCASKGYEIKPVSDANRFVQLADDRIERLRGRVSASLDIFDSDANGSSGGKGHQRDFYVLDGLPTDVLLGEDALYQMGAFTEHADSFFDVNELEVFSDLNLIIWLQRVEKRIMRSPGGSDPAAMENYPLEWDESQTTGKLAPVTVLLFGY